MPRFRKSGSLSVIHRVIASNIIWLTKVRIFGLTGSQRIDDRPVQHMPFRGVARFQTGFSPASAESQAISRFLIGALSPGRSAFSTRAETSAAMARNALRSPSFDALPVGAALACGVAAGPVAAAAVSAGLEQADIDNEITQASAATTHPHVGPL